MEKHRNTSRFLIKNTAFTIKIHDRTHLDMSNGFLGKMAEEIREGDTSVTA